MSDRLQDIAAGGAEPRKKGIEAWFAGRGRRREYWLWVAPIILLSWVLGAAGLEPLGTLVTVPVLFAFIRRLHDLGRSGWWAPVINIGCNVVFVASAAFGGEAGGGVVGSLAYLGAIVILGILPGEKGRNRYGPQPGQPDAAEAFS